ncbi:MAG: hypothetical protein JWM16_6293 [Verrucomicrobiales bacterium]|nr:hypothetical protein [Verrucomicrobiales bacterium]
MNTNLSGHSKPKDRSFVGISFRGLWAALCPALLAAGVVALVACASGYTRPLVSRGLPAEERKDYIIQNGFGIPENVKQAFLEGFVEVGMAREMVFQLYGAPDRTTGGDTNWEYVNNKGNLITGITFKNDKVEKVYGDPKGGNTSESKAATP